MSELEPITREEMFLAAAGGQSVELPEPITREEVFLKAIAEGGGGGGGVTDVQVNGQSVVSGGVANVPKSSGSTLGVVKVSAGLGTYVDSNDGTLSINCSNFDNIKAGTNQYKPIVPYNQHQSAFYGLAKAAGDSTQSASSNAVGTYTDEAKDKILAMLGIDALIAKHEGATASETKTAGDVFIHNGKLYKATESIASGAAIVPGTNCTQTTIIDELKGA